MNVKSGLGGRAVPFLGPHKWIFYCSVVVQVKLLGHVSVQAAAVAQLLFLKLLLLRLWKIFDFVNLCISQSKLLLLKL
jgi:hypothetical protein